MNKRKPQINFQVEPSMKILYEEAKAHGHWVTRLCAAGFLLMVEQPDVRNSALNRLRQWEAEFADADDHAVRDFVQRAQAAMQAALPKSPPNPATPPARKKAKRNAGE